MLARHLAISAHADLVRNFSFRTVTLRPLGIAISDQLTDVRQGSTASPVA